MIFLHSFLTIFSPRGTSRTTPQDIWSWRPWLEAPETKSTLICLSSGSKTAILPTQRESSFLKFRFPWNTSIPLYRGFGAHRPFLWEWSKTCWPSYPSWISQTGSRTQKLFARLQTQRLKTKCGKPILIMKPQKNGDSRNSNYQCRALTRSSKEIWWRNSKMNFSKKLLGSWSQRVSSLQNPISTIWDLWTTQTTSQLSDSRTCSWKFRRLTQTTLSTSSC